MNRMRFEWVVAFLAPLLLLAMNNASAQSPGETLGWTQYDYQANGATGQRVALDGDGGLHFTWMNGDPYPSVRHIMYVYIDPYGHRSSFDLGSGGFPQIAVNTQNQPGIVYHKQDSLIYWTLSGRYHVPDNGAWPALSIDRNDRSHVIYAGSYDVILSYSRSNDGGPTWTSPVPVDTLTFPSYTITSSPVSDKVSIIYLHPYDTSGYYNDVYCIQSLDGDSWDWQNGKVNITNYDFGALSAGLDVDAVYDYNDDLHVVWNVGLTTDSLETVFLFHYDQFSESIVEISHLTTPWLPGCDWGTWNWQICKMSIAATSDSFLAVAYTEFNPDDCSACGYANGEIYAQYSSDGQVWSAPINLTNSPTPGCLAGDCDSDHWSSMAERIDDYLHIFYVNDKDAGGIPQTEGSVTDNPMLYLRYPVDELGIGEPEIIPIEFETLGNYPNPFNSSTVISYNLEKESLIRLDIYDITGRRIAVLFDGVQEAGWHFIMWDAGDATSGIYFCRLETADKEYARKITLLR